jgi:hypothetical protein
VTGQAEARFGKVPTRFYVDMAQVLLKNKQKVESVRWLQYATQKAAPEECVLVMIGEMAMNIDAPLAMNYLQKALEAGQMPGQAHLLMGMLESRQDNQRTSKKHFSEAEYIARHTKDADLAKRVEMARILSSDADGLIHHLLDIGGEGLLEEFLSDFDEEFDDD